MEKVNLVELAKHIVSLQRDIYAEIRRSGKINPEKATLLADCRDYCFYQINPEKATLLADCRDYCFYLEIGSDC
jgi:hypothetical protein